MNANVKDLRFFILKWIIAIVIFIFIWRGLIKQANDHSMECKPIDKIRKARIFGLAIFDWVFSLAIAWIIGRVLLGLQTGMQWILFIIFWILFGIAAHVYYRVPTTMNYYLGLSDRPKNKNC